MSCIQSGVNNDAPPLSLSLAFSIDRSGRGVRNTLLLVFYARRKQLAFDALEGGRDVQQRVGKDREYDRNERMLRRMSKGWYDRNHCVIV